MGRKGSILILVLLLWSCESQPSRGPWFASKRTARGPGSACRSSLEHIKWSKGWLRLKGGGDYSEDEGVGWREDSSEAVEETHEAGVSESVGEASEEEGEDEDGEDLARDLDDAFRNLARRPGHDGGGPGDDMPPEYASREEEEWSIGAEGNVHRKGRSQGDRRMQVIPPHIHLLLQPAIYVPPVARPLSRTRTNRLLGGLKSRTKEVAAMSTGTGTGMWMEKWVRTGMTQSTAAILLLKRLA